MVSLKNNVCNLEHAFTTNKYIKFDSRIPMAKDASRDTGRSNADSACTIELLTCAAAAQFLYALADVFCSFTQLSGFALAFWHDFIIMAPLLNFSMLFNLSLVVDLKFGCDSIAHWQHTTYNFGVQPANNSLTSHNQQIKPSQFFLGRPQKLPKLPLLNFV